MSIIHCQNCSSELRLEDTDVIRLTAAGAHYQESTHSCPYCHSVLLLEVTMAEDEYSLPPALTVAGG